MRRRSHRYARPRPRTAATVATLVMMCVVLLVILGVGSDFASKMAGIFAGAPVEVETGTEPLPPRLPGMGEDGAGIVHDGALVPHTGALIRMAIRGASIVARRAIVRGHSPGVQSTQGVEPQ